MWFVEHCSYAIQGDADARAPALGYLGSKGLLASSISWVVAEYAYLKLTRASDEHLFLGAAVSGALSGAITGLTLVGLMRTGGQRNAPS